MNDSNEFYFSNDEPQIAPNEFCGVGVWKPYEVDSMWNQIIDLTIYTPGDSIVLSDTKYLKDYISLRRKGIINQTLIIQVKKRTATKPKRH